MGGLFSSKKKPESRVTDQDRAILELKKQRDQLRMYQRKIDAEQEKLKNLAKQLLKDGKKSKALLLLKKKKRQENLAEKTAQQIENMETLANDIEFAQMENKVFEGLKVGNQALKDIHKLMSLEEAEQIMDDTREAIEYQQQLTDILAGSISDEDESDILAELEAITSSTEKQIDQIPNLPDVPTEEPQVKQQEKSKEPRQERVALEAS
ncbi:charged multivesicular body protein 6-like isoform X2 [Styela clava]|uniref:charged multivesicular body protein 6-like n=1 Tax=Styela clava TaxID=7725 RepID=UPI001939282D|nr:charged multivesicular body protein 6-like [Styela clava]XP_039261422.1 charged multivesicular body protein 6-like [Styela clava]